MIGIVLLGLTLADEVPRRQRRGMAVGSRRQRVGLKVGDVVDQRSFLFRGGFLLLGLGRFLGGFVELLEGHERYALRATPLHLELVETANDALLGGGNLDGPHEFLGLLWRGHLDAFAAGRGGDEGIVHQPTIPRQQRQVELGRTRYLGLLHDLDGQGHLESSDAVHGPAVAGGDDNGPVGIATNDPKLSADPHVPTSDGEGIRHGVLDELVGALGILRIELLLQILQLVLHQNFPGEIFHQRGVDPLAVGGLPEGPAELRHLFGIGHGTGGLTWTLTGLGDDGTGHRTAHGGTYK